MTRNRLKQQLFWPLLTALLGLAAWAYAPGLRGAFLFDDFANLPALGASGPVDNWPTFWRYVTSGFADPVGRPLSMLSFLIDAHNWPADPYPFKRTNLILHLLNGVLLGLLLRKLGNYAVGRASLLADMAALLGASFWLLHPLFVSTTLYIIQREAMLPVSFSLLGFLAWLRGRDLMMSGRTSLGACWVTLGLVGCTLLAILCKANGVLLPALALVIEYIFLRPSFALRKASQEKSAFHQDSTSAVTGVYPFSRFGNLYKAALIVFAWLPSAVVFGYLVQQGWSGMLHGISSVRPWTLGQRLLTEPRILMDYLRLLWLPRQSTPGLFNDHILVSTSLISPATTLPALAALFALVTGAWLIRRTHPAFALAVFFYLVGQSLESSTVALELYFEHRNYLPSLFMFWPLSLWLCGLQWNKSLAAVGSTSSWLLGSGGVRLKLVLAFFLLLGLTLITRARADLWGNVQDQALLWATLNPDSPRAQANAAQLEIADGHPALAAARIRQALEKEPGEIQLALNLFGAECEMGGVTPSTMLQTKTALATTRDPGTLLADWFERAIDQSAKPSCPQIELTSLESLLSSARANSRLMAQPGRRQDIDYIQGRIALAGGDADSALQDFNLALDQQVRETAAFKQAALLGSSGFPLQGLAHLDHYESKYRPERHSEWGMPAIHDWVLKREQYWPKEMVGLRSTLSQDAASQLSNKK